jgi:hypothetical protein
MLEALARTLREGLSAFLVVAVVMAFFTYAGRHSLRRAAQWGIGLSVPATVIATALFAGAENQALWEGVLSLSGAVCVAWISYYLWRTSRQQDAGPHVVTWVAICAARDFSRLAVGARRSSRQGPRLRTSHRDLPAGAVRSAADRWRPRNRRSEPRLRCPMASANDGAVQHGRWIRQVRAILAGRRADRLVARRDILGTWQSLRWTHR